MTGKERVLSAIAMKPTDRQARDFHACDAVLERLHAHFGTTSYRQLLDRLHVDMVDIRGVVDPLWVADFPKIVTRPDGTTEDYLGFCRRPQQTVFGAVEEHCDYSIMDCTGIEEIASRYTFPKVEWFDFSRMNLRLAEYGDLAVMASGASVFQHPTLLRGIDQFLCDLIAEPQIAGYIIDGYVNFYFDYFGAMFSACPGQIDILRIADDFGMQDRPIIGPELMSDFFLPRIRRLCDLAHGHNVKVMFHSCGSVFEFIDPLLEAGVDLLDPLQLNARGMDPGNLARHFKGRVCFHGSIDTQYVLPRGATEEVRAQVRRHAAILGGDGTGFIIAPAHSLQPDVSTDNIIALYDEIDQLSGLGSSSIKPSLQ